jgi:hypothetical protein
MALASTGTSFNNGIPPSAPSSFARTGKKTLDVEPPKVFVPGSISEYKEDDIFVPRQSSKLSEDKPQHYSAKTGYDNSEDNDPANEGSAGASYDDLVARFDQLNK